jgi:hypothetical protein
MITISSWVRKGLFILYKNEWLTVFVLVHVTEEVEELLD